MGDEMHQRNVAASALLGRVLMPHVARGAPRTPRTSRGSPSFIGGNDQFFLNLAMAAGKAIADPALGIAGSTMVADDGAQRHRLRHPRRRPRRPLVHRAGEHAARPLLPRLRPADANPDIGDSAIVETIGLGGFAMAAAPAVVRFVGAGGLADALSDHARRWREIAPGRASRTSASPRSTIARHARRHRRAPSGRDGHRAAHQHRHRAAGSPASARSAPAWCARRWPASKRRWPRSSRSLLPRTADGEVGAFCKARGRPAILTPMPPSLSPAAVGQPAPLFSLPSLVGNTVDLSGYRGHRNVVVWFSRGFTCPFCLDYMDGIREGYQDAPRREHRGHPGRAQPAGERHAASSASSPAPFPLVCDPDKRLYAVYGLGDRGALEASGPPW